MKSYVYYKLQNFQTFWKKIEIIMNFLRKNEENSYQIQNILKKFEMFAIDV